MFTQLWKLDELNVYSIFTILCMTFEYIKITNCLRLTLKNRWSWKKNQIPSKLIYYLFINSKYILFHRKFNFNLKIIILSVIIIIIFIVQFLNNKNIFFIRDIHQSEIFLKARLKVKRILFLLLTLKNQYRFMNVIFIQYSR